MPRVIDIMGVGAIEFPDEMTDDQIISVIEGDLIPNAGNPDPELVSARPDLFPDIDRGSLFGGLGSGAERLGRAPEAAGAAIGRSQEELDSLKAQMAEEEQAQRYRASLSDVTTQWGRGDYLGAAGTLFGDVLPQTLGESLPDMGLIGAGAVAGAKIGAGAGAVTTGPLAPIGAGLGALAGAVVGGAVAGLPTFFGMNVERQIQEREITDPNEIETLKAASAAALQGGMESLIIPALGWIPGVRGLAAPALRKLIEGGVKKLTLPQAGRIVGERALAGGATEALTEVGQQMLERAQAGLAVTDPEALAEYVEAAVLGGLLGVGFGGVTGTYGAYKTNRDVQKHNALLEQAEALHREAVRKNMEREAQTYTDPETGEKRPVITDPARLLPSPAERNKYAYDGADLDSSIAARVNATLA